jgi:hypothetical protein
MENKDNDKKVQLNTKVSAHLLKKFKIYCIETDKNINYYIEKMMREKLDKSN